YLTRPEGGLVLVAAGVVLLGMQLSRVRRSGRQLLACGASLTLAAVVVGSPLWLATGRITTKPSVDFIVGTPHAQAEEAPGPNALFATVFNLEGSSWQRLARALHALAVEMVNAFHYLGWIPALLGLWWFRGQLRSVPGAWLILVLCLLHALVLCRLAVSVGYLSDRHVLVLVLCGVYFVAAGLDEMGRRLAGEVAG